MAATTMMAIETPDIGPAPRSVSPRRHPYPCAMAFRPSAGSTSGLGSDDGRHGARHHGPMTTWGHFAAAEPELADFARARLHGKPSYLATVRADGSPRVHPVTPIVTVDGM